MARSFTRASSHSISCSAGSVTHNAAFTWVAILKRASDGTSQAILSSYRNATQLAVEFYLSSGDELAIWNDQTSAGTDGSATTGVVAADGWCLVAVSKATGTATPRFHRYKYSTSAAAHENGAASIASNSDSLNHLRIGEAPSEFFDGEIAAAAAFTRALTDAELDTLSTSLAAWVAAAPAAMWVLDQAATTMPLRDWVGGSHQSAISGTAVGTLSPPLSYGAPVLPSQSISAGGTDGTATPGVIAVSATLPAVTTQAGATAAPASIAAPVTLPAATAGGHATAAPATIEAPATLPAVTTQAGATATPTTLAATVTLPAPTTQAGATAAPATITAAVTLPAPTATGAGNAAPATIAATITMPAPTATGGGEGTATPGVIAATVTMPAATTQAGATASPATLAATVTLPAPTTQAGATTSPTVIPLTVTLPAATATGGTAGTATPATIAATVTLPAATLSYGYIVTPAVIAVVVTMAAATATGIIPAGHPITLTLRDGGHTITITEVGHTATIRERGHTATVQEQR